MSDDNKKIVEDYLRDVDEFIGEIDDMINETTRAKVRPVEDDSRVNDETPKDSEVSISSVRNGRRLYPSATVLVSKKSP